MRPPNRVARSTLAALMIALTLLSTSCATIPVAPVSLALDWPVVPDPTGQVSKLPAAATVTVEGDTTPLMLPADTVVMPLDYWLALVDYVIGVRRVQALLGAVHGPVSIEPPGAK